MLNVTNHIVRKQDRAFHSDSKSHVFGADAETVCPKGLPNLDPPAGINQKVRNFQINAT